jgi:nitroimidazol reductase NimA-like FMN-containing flavoprotein (pyridoxamine 5'-phosphate oxidase superfamily)
MRGPRADRPHVPGYGIPTSTDGLLSWAWARERLERALVYRLATSSPDGRPHLIPIWGAWVDDRWYVEGGPTRWQRNLRANPWLAIEVESGSETVIVEGRASELVAPPTELATRIVSGYAKYREPEDYAADPANWAAGGLWELVPDLAFAWSTFPKDMTRFTFGAR